MNCAKYISKEWRKLVDLKIVGIETKNVLLALGAIAFIHYFVIGFIKKRVFMRKQYKRMRLEQDRRRKNFEKYEEMLVDDDEARKIGERIKQEGSESIMKAVQGGELALLDVVNAYGLNLKRAQDAANPVNEYLLDFQEHAKQLQEQFEANPQQLPLYGLTISVKDRFTLQGTQSTGGLVSCLDKADGEPDSFVVQALRRAGAVALCKTNSPQTNMSYACSNPIYGTTHNPYQKHRSPGGSSGGEGCVSAYAACSVGVASDVAGSVRIPATFSGVAGLKPCSARLGVREMIPLLDGAPPVETATGLISRETDLISHSLKSILTPDFFECDDYIHPKPFNEAVYNSNRPLRIGYYLNDGYFTPFPACVSAVKKAKSVLEQCGHTLVPFELPRDGDFRVNLNIRLMRSGLEDIFDNCLPNEPYDAFAVRRMPNWARKLLGGVLNPILGLVMKRSAGNVKAIERNKRAIDTYYAMHDSRSYKAEFLKAMKEAQIDAFICPAFGTTTVKHHHCKDLLPAISYTTLFNLLNLPAGVVPVGTVTEQDERALKEDYDTEFDFTLLLAKYSCLGSVGMPVSAQVVSFPYEEEMVLRIMRELEKNCGYVQPPVVY